MSDNWVVQNLENALATWNEKLAEIWQLITQSPETFKGGTIWNVVLLIHDTMQAIGLALLVLFFVVGVVKTCGSFAEIKRPEAAVKLFIRFALAKAVVTYGLELMMALFTIVQGVISSIMSAAGMGAAQETVLPAEIVTAIESCGFWESIPPLGGGADRWSFYHDLVFCHGLHGIWPLFPSVYLHGHRPDPPFDLCGGTQPANWQEFFEILCRRVSGGSHYRAGLHHLLPVCIQPARR